MQKNKQEEDDEYNFRRQFELQEKLVEPKALSKVLNFIYKFKDILNQAKDVNCKKRNQLLSYQLKEPATQFSTFEDKTLDFIQDQTEQVLVYQTFLKTKLDHTLKAKLLLDKKINHYRENLNHIKLDPGRVQKELDEKVKCTLKQTKTNTLQFQKQLEKFRSQSEKNQEKQSKNIDNSEQSLKEIQQKIKKLKQQNEELLQQIQMLHDQEEIKKQNLEECFQISEYIEFFIEVKMKVLDQLGDSESESSQMARSYIQNQRHSTRNEIISLVDEFYKNQNITKLSQQIIDAFHYLNDNQNMKTSEYNFFTEEKALRLQQIALLDEEIQSFRGVIQFDDDPQIGSFQNILIEGPQVSHENYQLNYHLRGYQLCLITIHQRLIDMISRICSNIIWISETTKLVPKSLDNKCMMFLKTYTKNDINLYVPLASTSSLAINKSIQSKQQGQYVQLNRRNGSMVSEEMWSEKKIETEPKNEFLNRFKKHKDYEYIERHWNNLARNDLLLRKFALELSFDQIDIASSPHEIVCQMYETYYKHILEIDFLKYFSVQFQYYKEIMTVIYQKTQTYIQQSKTSLTLVQKFHNEVTSPFIQSTKQIQIKRLQELANSTFYDNETIETSQKTINAADDRKYHEYFIHESTKIKKQFPVLQDQLVSKTLQDIDVMRQKELNDNYQQSDQISSDQDYLNQERRNLKGILSKKNQKPSTSDSKESNRSKKSTSNSKTKIIKQVQLLYKINKLSSTTRKLQSSNSFNQSLTRYTEGVKRKISDYFTPKLDLDFCQKEDKSILIRPFQQTLSASKSLEPPPLTPISEKQFALDRLDSIRQIYQQDSTLFNSARKEKSFLIKRKQ